MHITPHTLDRIAFIGRTFDEYVRLFGLDDEALSVGRILDCPAGASSFTAEGTKLGYDITACDILYAMEREPLEKKAREDTEAALSWAYKVKENYNWELYGGIEAHRAGRLKALEAFIRDFSLRDQRNRYVAAELPRLPFSVKSFSLVLSGHFLFMYGDRLSFDFHLKSVRELLRVGREVRIYPLTGLDGKRWPHMDELVRTVTREGVAAVETAVPFEFLKGADTMLKLY